MTPHDLPANADDDPACREVIEIMTEYLEGALREVEARRLERHLPTCPGCTEYLDQLRTLAGSLGELGGTAVPADARAQLLANFRENRPKGP